MPGLAGMACIASSIRHQNSRHPFDSQTPKPQNQPPKTGPMKKLKNLRPLALIAVGVFLGRGAQADTTITFDCTPVPNNGDILSDCVPPQLNNPNGPPGITN